MEYTMIEIWNKAIKKDNKKYEFIIEEKFISGWGRQFACGRRRPKFYTIKENGKTILSSTRHQTFYGYKRKLEKDMI